jgi:hypothetical protein
MRRAQIFDSALISYFLKMFSGNYVIAVKVISNLKFSKDFIFYNIDFNLIPFTVISTESPSTDQEYYYDTDLELTEFGNINKILNYAILHKALTDDLIYKALSSGMRYVILQETCKLEDDSPIEFLTNCCSNKYTTRKFTRKRRPVAIKKITLSTKSSSMNQPIASQKSPDAQVLYTKYSKLENSATDIYKLITEPRIELLEIACKYNYDDIFDDFVNNSNFESNITMDMYTSNLKYILYTNYQYCMQLPYNGIPDISDTNNFVEKSSYSNLDQQQKIYVKNNNYRDIYILGYLYKAAPCEINDIKWISDSINNNELNKKYVERIVKYIKIADNNFNKSIMLNNNILCSYLKVTKEDYVIEHHKYQLDAKDIYSSIINQEVLTFREMFKSNKIEKIIKHMEIHKLVLDQFCANNAYYFNNKAVIKMFSPNVRPTKNCVLAMLINSKNITPQVSNIIYEMMQIDKYEDLEKKLN